MANETSYVWDGIVTGDAGPFSSAEWATLWQNLIGIGAGRANVGVMLGSGTQPNDGLKVQAKAIPTTQIDMLIGAASVQGRVYVNSGTQTFTIAANGSGNARIDTVILRADYSLQTVRAAVLQGTPAASPTPPALTQSAGVLWEIPIADIAVANGFVTITNANITPRHEWVNAANGVYLDNVLNNSGGTLVTGDVVIWDTSTDRAVTTTTTADNPLLAGVWVGRTANGGYGRVLRSGIGYVNGGAAITRGAVLINSGTAKQALSTALRPLGARLGRALETTSGSGLILSHVHVQASTALAIALLQDQKSSGTAATSLTSGAWRTRDLNTIVSDPNTLVTSLAANQATIVAGTYLVFATGQAGVVTSNHRLRIRNITDTATLVQGNNFATITNLAPEGALIGAFAITAAKLIELQHFPSATVNGGAPVTTGDVEVYAAVLLVRVGD